MTGRGQESMDITSWNISDARLPQVLAALLVREGRVLLQELCVPKYSTFCRERENNKGSGVAIALRRDLMTRFSVDVEQAEKHCAEMSKEENGRKRRTAAVCIPPEGSGHYSDDVVRRQFYNAAHLDTLAGDFNWRVAEQHWRDIVAADKTPRSSRAWAGGGE